MLQLFDGFGVETLLLVAISLFHRNGKDSARAKLDEMGIPHKKRAAVQLSKEDYTTYDYLLCMEQWNINNVKRIIGHDPKHKVHLLLEYAGVKRDIADPWYTGNFDVTYDDIVQGCEAFLEELGV